MIQTRRLLATIAICAIPLLPACGKKAAVAGPPMPPPVVEEAPPAPPSPPEPAPASAPVAPALSEDEIFARKTVEALNAERPLAGALFDVDQATIREDARVALQRDAEWLRRWTSTRVTIEGHCDARGTSEYNLALGERRASAVKDYLVSLGVDGSRLFVISKGKESPVCFDENEGCWQQNRRAHQIITAK
jgi:peptidoglycan-associated lipoprotein